MEINIAARHLELTDAMRAHVHKKVTNALSEFPRVESVHIILTVEKYRHQCEIFVQAPHHIRVDARETSEDMYASIDIVIEKIVRQLRRHRDRLQDHKSRESLSQNEITLTSHPK